LDAVLAIFWQFCHDPLVCPPPPPFGDSRNCQGHCHSECISFGSLSFDGRCRFFVLPLGSLLRCWAIPATNVFYAPPRDPPFSFYTPVSLSQFGLWRFSPLLALCTGSGLTISPRGCDLIRVPPPPPFSAGRDRSGIAG